MSIIHKNQLRTFFGFPVLSGNSSGTKLSLRIAPSYMQISIAFQKLTDICMFKDFISTI